MNDTQFEQIKAQLPKGEHFTRLYRAVEGDLRVISTDERGFETRYTISFDAEGNPEIRKM